MPGLLSSLFRSSKPAPQTANNQPGRPLTADNGVSLDKALILKRIAQETLDSCPLIRTEARSDVLAYILDQTQLFTTKTPLTTEQKVALGANTRLKLTAELAAVLTEEGMRSHYPAEILPNLHRAAHFRYQRIMELAKLRRMNICKTVTFHNAVYEDSCEWCQSQEGKKLEIKQDVAGLLHANCKCEPYWKGYLAPDITGDEEA